ncbi:MAG: hypothetical protein WAV73_05265 [Candidatus Moraniibacteriota bacterium]
MREIKWAMGMLFSLCIFIVFFFARGAKNYNEIIVRFSYFKNVLAGNPNFLWIALGIGIFVGIIFWIIKTFGSRKEDLPLVWVSRSIFLLVGLFFLIYAALKIIELFASGKV